MATGLDAIGVAASIIQLADFGARLSIKLYTFYHQVKSADERLNGVVSLVHISLRTELRTGRGSTDG